ncbi:MAG: hypothetical protein LUD29_00915 [Clostridia bacterium]|nr:hypothetical protein [Clostridia bacterium]
MYSSIEPGQSKYVDEAENFCRGILESLRRKLCDKHKISAEIRKLGDGDTRLLVQNDARPIAFDYFLVIHEANNLRKTRKIRRLKEKIRKDLDEVLLEKDSTLGKMEDMGYVENSTSALTSPPLLLVEHTFFKFYFDLSVMTEDDEGFSRLVRKKKKGTTGKDAYSFDRVPNSSEIFEKYDSITAQSGGTELVRDLYLKAKNRQLKGKNKGYGAPHTSFVCFVEAVNEAQSRLAQKNASRKHR